MEFDSRLGTISPASIAIVGIAAGVFVSFIHMVWSEGRLLAAQEAAERDTTILPGPAGARPPATAREPAANALWTYRLNRG